MSELDVLQTVLAGEHAAVYGFSVLGARTSQSLEAGLYAALRSAYETHRDRRDVLTGHIAALGEVPVAAAAAYVAPDGLDTLEGRTAAALALEQGCASTYAGLVGTTTAERRAEAVAWLDDAAVRGLSFRGNPEIFPGADDLADR